MSNKVSLTLPFLSARNSSGNTKAEEESVKRNQSAVFSSFNARRNAGRIERYFHKIRGKRINYALYVIGSALIVTVIIINVIYVRSFFLDSLQRITNLITTAHQAKVKEFTSAALFEAYFFTHTIANLLGGVPMLKPNKEDAIPMTRLLIKAHIVSNGRVIWRDVANIHGGLISVETYVPKSSQVQLLFCDTYDDYQGALYSWNSDDAGYNESYPDIGGSFVVEFDSRKREWYKSAVSRKTSLWTELYFGNGSVINAPIVSSVSPQFDKDTGEVIAVVANGIQMTMAQSLLEENNPTNYSRFALATEQGTLISVTGEEDPIDFYKGNIVMKTVFHLRDPVWSVITKDSRFIKGDNFTASFMVFGSYRSYSVIQTHVQVAPGMKWKLYSLLCTTDMIGSETELSKTNFIISLALVAGIWLLLIFISILMRRFMLSAQNRIMTSQRNEAPRHVKRLGILPAIKELQNLVLLHADRKPVTKCIREAINLICSSSDNLFVDTTPVYKSISDKRVLQYMKSTYGETSPLEVKEIRFIRETENTKSSLMFFFSLPRDRVPMEDLVDAFNQSPAICHYSDLGKLFSEPLKIMPEREDIIIDSLSFCKRLCEKCVRCNESNDVCLASMITTLCWHSAIAKQGSNSDKLEDKFFLRDELGIKQEAWAFLRKMKKVLLSSPFSGEDRWKNLTRMIMNMCESSTLPMFSHVMTQTTLVTFSGASELSIQQAEITCTFIFICSTFSHYYLDYSRIDQVNSVFLKNEAHLTSDSFRLFKKCFGEEYLKPASLILKRMYDKGQMF